MAEKIDVTPTPIQRNRRDVAIELTQMYISLGNYTIDEMTDEKLIQLYKKFHQAAVQADNTR